MAIKQGRQTQKYKLKFIKRTVRPQICDHHPAFMSQANVK